MAINFSKIDKNIYSSNSIFFPGTLSNTALKAAASAAVITSLIFSSTLLASGLHAKVICGVALVSGTGISAIGGVLWYRYRVSEIQAATKMLIKQVRKNTQEKEMRKFLNRMDFQISEYTFPCFLLVEFMQRLETILKSKENFQVANLISLLRSQYFLCDERYLFLANQILKLDDETKDFILKQESSEAQQLICKMMLQIRWRKKDVFDAFYKIISDSIRKEILISLGNNCLKYIDIDHTTEHHSTKHLAMALKQTPDLPKRIEEIIKDNLSFCEALSKVYSEEFKHADNIEASTPFLIDLYPFLKGSQITRAFYVNTRGAIPEDLDLWIEVVRQTGVAFNNSENFIAALTQETNKKPSLIDFFKSRWDFFREGFKKICQDIKEPTNFSLFVHLLNSELSEEERIYVQQLMVLELGDLTELAPEFLQVWLEDKNASISKVCEEYIQNEPSKEKIAAFFKALSLEQKFEWLQSPQRQSINFKEKNLMEYRNFYDDLLSKMLRFRCLDRSSNPYISNVRLNRNLLNKINLKGVLIDVDFLLFWKDIHLIKDRSEKIAWMKKLYQWGKKGGNELIILGLIYFEQGRSSTNYVKEMGLEECAQTASESRSEELPIEQPPEITEAEVLEAVKELNLDPNGLPTKNVLRKMLKETHPDKNKQEGATEKFQKIFPLVSLIINYIEKMKKNERSKNASKD